MKNKLVSPAIPQLPPVGDIQRVFELRRSDITAYELNPFSFYIKYDHSKMQNVDCKVQEFGQRYSDDQYVGEPADYAMVRRDDRWHRAHILGKRINAQCECGGAEVLLIDTGHRILVDAEQIFPMPPEVLTAGPAQCLRIFPKEIQGSPRQISELFEHYPSVTFKVTLDGDLNRSEKQKPHLAGVLAEVEVGFEEWISLKQLFLTNFIEDSQDTNSASGTSNNSEARRDDETFPPTPEEDSRAPTGSSAELLYDSNGHIRFEPLDPPDADTAQSSTAVRPKTRPAPEQHEHRPRGSSSTTPPDLMDLGETWGARVEQHLSPTPRRHTTKIAECNGSTEEVVRASQTAASSNGFAEERIQRLDPGPVDSDDDSSSAADDSSKLEAEENIRYYTRNGAIPVDVEGENQGEIITARNIAHAKQAAQRNQFRQKICQQFRQFGKCTLGQLCPHSHSPFRLEEATTIAGTTREFRDYPDIPLKKDFHGFGVCTHVDEDGMMYLVLPYGAASVWDVLECKSNLEVDMRKIPEELSKLYDHQRGKKRNPMTHENLAVVWIDKPDSGPLRNVRQGWYRAKILTREEKNCQVFLVDHGAVLTISAENLYPLDADLLQPQQAIRCKLQDTIFEKQPGNSLRMYELLKQKMLVFKVYEVQGDTNPHVVELVEVSNEGSEPNHLGELLVENKIVGWVDLPPE